MRSTAGAEAEIQVVVNDIMKVCRDRWPSVFQDFSSPLQGGWVPKYDKV